MADDSWSDSDSDDGGTKALQTEVLLGLPDGDVHDANELRDPEVSRLGGLPVSNDFDVLACPPRSLLDLIGILPGRRSPASRDHSLRPMHRAYAASRSAVGSIREQSDGPRIAGVGLRQDRLPTQKRKARDA